MSAAHWSLVIIWGGAIPTTTFVLLYGLTRPWWLSWPGRALLVSSFALMLLFDLSVFTHYHPLTLTVTQGNAIVSLAVLGAWLKLTALLLDLYQARGTQR